MEPAQMVYFSPREILNVETNGLPETFARLISLTGFVNERKQCTGIVYERIAPDWARETMLGSV